MGAASELFYLNGIRAVGVDTIIERAGVAKATLYRHFPSKDDLIVAWLADHDAKWFAWFEQAVATRAQSGRERALALFDALQEHFEQRGWRGCAFINGAVELPDPAHPAHRIIAANKRRVEAYIREALEDAGLPDADQVAGQIYLLVEGAIVAALIQGSSEPARIAGAAAERLLTRSGG